VVRVSCLLIIKDGQEAHPTKLGKIVEWQTLLLLLLSVK